MKRIYSALVIVLVLASSAFSDPTDELFEAVRYEDTSPDKIHELIRKGARVNAKSQDGYTPLMRASAVNPNPDIILALLRESADVKAKDVRGYTALTRAVLNYYPSYEVVKLLIDSGSSVNVRSSSGSTILIHAARDNPNQTPEIITELLRAGADIASKDNDGRTVLDYGLTDEIRQAIENYGNYKKDR